MIESIYANDRVECRQRYANLRVTGLDLRKYKSPKAAVLGYSEHHRVKMKPSQITNVKELREGDKYNPLLVSFDTANSRELFIEAKFNAINARTAVAKKIQLMDTGDEQNIATAETMKKNELYPLKRVRIQEDTLSSKSSKIHLRLSTRTLAARSSTP